MKYKFLIPVIFVILSAFGIKAGEVYSLYDVVRDGRAGIYLEGRGNSVGEIFTVKYEVSEPVTIFIPAGMVFSPENTRYQKVMTDKDLKIRLEPPVGKFIITGYCLEPWLSPPPGPGDIKKESDMPGYRVLPVLKSRDDYSSALAIIRAGRSLYKNHRLHDDLGNRHLQTVTGWAIWHSATRHKADGWNKIRLINDITRQVQESGPNKTPAQIQELADNLWDDIKNIIIYSDYLH
ncbi:MAG: hypothetical protein J7M18_06490 [Candidatus Eremiobacteraeota bacterium]|nr:hypothetical protein [Candidatus Eremiobacteraeota bacterium]